MRKLASVVFVTAPLAVAVVSCGDGPTGLKGMGNFQIAFGTARDGNFEIYVMGADGSNPSNLTNNAAWDGDPAWSPVR